MGYRVDYQPIKKIRGAERNRTRVAALTALCMILFVFLVNTMWPQGSDVLQEILFSEKTVVAADAFGDFENNLDDGHRFFQAAEAFFKSIF